MIEPILGGITGWCFVYAITINISISNYAFLLGMFTSYIIIKLKK